MTVLDVGCGPGFFSIEIADMVGASGRVISADLQEGMLDLVRSKIRGTELENRVTLVLCDKDKLNVTDNVDMILAFYVAHEVPDKDSLFSQLKRILKPDGMLLLIEPKLFHVSRVAFKATVAAAERAGFKTHEGPKLPFSWSALLRH
jgi:ubiquinone/menaquinone biosynthesis C-methylase UbiE